MIILVNLKSQYFNLITDWFWKHFEFTELFNGENLSELISP